MARIRDIYDIIDAVAPFSTALDFDNAGLLVGAALLCISNLAILIMSRTRTASVVLETVSREQ